MVLVDTRSYSQRGYIAPSVFLKKDARINSWNYYASLKQAVNKYLFLHGKGGSDETPIGFVSFANSNQAQTLGLLVDFYTPGPLGWVPLSYSSLRSLATWPPIVFRFYDVNGNGPYYAVLEQKYLGIAATVVSDTSPDKVAALDTFHREIQLLKLRYNTLVSFLNELSRQALTPAEQQIFNEGILIATNMANSIRSISGVEIIYSRDGRIGVPVLLLIAVILILTAATAWTVATIYQEAEKTKRINDAYELSKWVAEKKIEVAQKLSRGEISSTQASSIISTLDKAQTNADKIAVTASKSSGGLFSDTATIVKYGAIAYMAYLFLGKTKKQSA